MTGNQSKKIVGEFSYDDSRKEYSLFRFCGNQAIKEASKDLVKCYKNAFKRGLDVGKSRSIALPTLSTDLGFPRDIAASIAVVLIFKYIKKYDRIELVVETDFEFDMYKKLLKECVAEELKKSMDKEWEKTDFEYVW